MILADLVTPPAQEVQIVTLNIEPPTIKLLRVPFRSIDAGEPLVAVFWIDLESSQAQADKSDPLLPDPLSAPRQSADSRPLDEQTDRVVKFDFDASKHPAGCHIVTMRLAHESTYPPDPERSIYVPGRVQATNQLDIAEVNWWFDVRDQTPAQPSCWDQK